MKTFFWIIVLVAMGAVLIAAMPKSDRPPVAGVTATEVPNVAGKPKTYSLSDLARAKIFLEECRQINQRARHFHINGC
jgi:hypothetical protein